MIPLTGCIRNLLNLEWTHGCICNLITEQENAQEDHLPGAITIPHDEIRDRAPDELADREATIVVYCASTTCRNSRIAAQTLTAMGYRNVVEYVGGKQDWTEAGFPLHGEVAA